MADKPESTFFPARRSFTRIFFLCTALSLVAACLISTERNLALEFLISVPHFTALFTFLGWTSATVSLVTSTREKTGRILCWTTWWLSCACYRWVLFPMH